MTDLAIRELERQWFLGDPEAKRKLIRELERRGVLSALQVDLGAVLDRVQQEPAWSPSPTTSKLALEHLAEGVRQLSSDPDPAWRLIIADHHFRSPTSSPESTCALLCLEGDDIVVAVGRGDANVAAELRRTATDGPALASSLERALGSVARFRLSRGTLAAWAAWSWTAAWPSDAATVRLRPSMYVGSVHERGIHALVDEILAIPLDLAAHGLCRCIGVSVEAGGAIRIEHDGPGIPVDLDTRFAIPILEGLFTHLGRTSFQFGKVGYEIRGGLHGVGVSTVNALSSWLEVESRHGGKAYLQRFERGLPTGPVELLGRTDARGVRVSFLPDPAIFASGVAVSFERLRARLRELAFLNKGLRLVLEDRRDRRSETHLAPRGLLDAFPALALEGSLLERPIHAEARVDQGSGRDPVLVEAVVTWTRHADGRLLAFANGDPLSRGAHVEGLLQGITSALESHARRRRVLRRVRRKDARTGLVAAIAVHVPELAVTGCVGDTLASNEAKPAVRSTVRSAIEAFTRDRPREADLVLDRLIGGTQRPTSRRDSIGTRGSSP